MGYLVCLVLIIITDTYIYFHAYESPIFWIIFSIIESQDRIIGGGDPVVLHHLPMYSPRPPESLG